MIEGRSRRSVRLVRAAATGFIAATLVLAGASSASADNDTNDVKATPHTGETIKVLDGRGNPIGVSRISLDFGGSKALAYCIDIKTGLRRGEEYVERSWGDGANPHSKLAKIQWILTHSVPNVSAAEVLRQVNANSAAATAKLNADQVVYTGTQAAVWHFSDGFVLGAYRPGKGTPSEASYAAITAVYKYLTGKANTGAKEPGPSLSVSPLKASAAPGEKAGPFTISTTADKVTITPNAGAKVVDAKGNPVKTAKNGDKFYVVADKEGDASVTVSGTGKVPTGRVFVYAKQASKGQRIILAGSAKKDVKVDVAANFKPVPGGGGEGPELPVTGASLPWIVGAAMVLLAAGATLLVVARRRRLT